MPRGATSPVLIDSDGPDDILVVPEPGSERAQVLRWAADTDHPEEVATIDPGGSAGDLAIIPGHDGLVVIGAGRPRDPFVGLLAVLEDSGQVASLTPVTLPERPSPGLFGRLSGRSVAVDARGMRLWSLDESSAVSDMSLPGRPASMSFAQDFAAGVGVGMTEATFVDPSERLTDVPAYFWLLDASGAVGGGRRPVLTGSCSTASVAVIDGEAPSYAMAHDCSGSPTVTWLCAGP
jgi:hypothetical protein